MVKDDLRDHIKKVSKEMVQVQWFLRLLKQVQFSNHLEVLSNDYLRLTITQRRLPLGMRRQELLPRKRKRSNINWWKNVMPAIKERLDLYASQQIVPTLRGMFYTLVSLNILQNTSVRYDYLSRFTARARENGDLEIDCFADNVRQVIEIDDD